MNYQKTDWKRYVRDHLPPAGLSPEREMEVVEELAAHLASAYEEALSAGKTDEEAWRRAAALISNWQALARDLARSGRKVADLLIAQSYAMEDRIVQSSRQRKIGALAAAAIQDVRFGARLLVKNPGFTAIAVITLALGIAANSAIFSVLNAALLQPLPVKEPGALAGLYRKIPQDENYNRFSYPNYVDVRDRNRSLTGLAAYYFAPFNLSTGAETERALGKIVSGNYFSVLGVEPALGRTFLPEEDRTPGAQPVAIISHGLWQRRFGGDSALIGRGITLNGHPFTIIGVAAEGFRGTEVGMVPDIYVPMMMQRQAMNTDDWLAQRGIGWLRIIGRLKPGVSVEAARAELEGLGGQLRQEHPQINDAFGIAVVADFGIHPNFRGNARRFLLLLIALVGLVLLIACANIAGLLLARAAERRREIGVRLALGASRGRLFRQMLTESLVLALIGGVIGLALTPTLISSLEWLLYSSRVMPSAVALDLDTSVLFFTAAVSIATGLIFGAAPAFSAARTGVAGVIKEDAGGRASGSTRLRSVFVVAQIALSLLLLAAAGLFVRSLQRAQGIDPGFDSENLLLMSFDLGLQGYKPEQIRNFQQQIVERVAALPGTREITLANAAPLTNDADTTVGFEDYQPPAGLPGVVINFANIAPSYFQTMGIQIVEGRAFTAQDREGAPPAAIINETAARRFASGVGKRIFFGKTAVEVVGVARNSKYVTIGETDRPYLYLPLAQSDGALTLIVRTPGDPAQAPMQAIDGVRQTVRSLDPNLPVYDIKTMNQHMRGALVGARLGALVLSVLGFIALLLAALGIYGVMASAVNRRTREIGIRIALGANARDVVKMIVWQGTKMTVIGVVPGLIAALAAMRLLKGFLYDVDANDPLTFAAIILLLVATSLLACYIPARRAARVDPIQALRYD
jgi:putative ABC transport system permease protein